MNCTSNGSILTSQAPIIDELHKKVLEARKVRTERFAIRRQQDIQDELDECKGQLLLCPVHNIASTDM